MIPLVELSRLNRPVMGKASKNAVHQAMDKWPHLLSYWLLFDPVKPMAAVSIQVQIRYGRPLPIKMSS